MKRKKVYPIVFVIILLAFTFSSGQGMVSASTEEPPIAGVPGELTQPKKYVMVDANEAMQGIQFPAETEPLSRAAGATFNITYVSNGGTDNWGQPCVTFPENAKAAFNYAAAIWAAKISSPVPITIRACWASLADPSVLGYSGGGTLHFNFPGAPLPDTIYTAALANSLYGSDMSSNEDMHITYNTNFSWYFGLDGNPGPGKYDLVTVAAHEIAHGLNFSGSASMSGAIGDLGYIEGGQRLFNVYDTFMRDWLGDRLVEYSPIPSTLLGDTLTSDNLWFHGPNAMAAEGSRVQMYAPTTWAEGSSYAHLNYGTYSGTINSMMVYAVAPNSSQHNPGPVTEGLLEDLGWTSVPNYFVYLPIMVQDTGALPPDPIVNGGFEDGMGVGWSEGSTNGWQMVTYVTASFAHSGEWVAFMGADFSETSWVSQSITVPVGRSLLNYWYIIDSAYSCGSDYFRVYVDATNPETLNLCTANNSSGWERGSIDLSVYQGSTITLKFEVTTTPSTMSAFYLDDVSLEATSRAVELSSGMELSPEVIRLRR